jgi:predicted MPP superfamily phosphohydrolase
MIPYARHFPALIILLVALALHFQMWRWLKAGRSRGGKWLITLAALALAALLVLGFLLGAARVVAALPPGHWTAWARAAAIGWAMLSTALFLALAMWHGASGFDPGRRRVMRTAGGALFAAPALALGYGAVVERARIRAVETDLLVDGLPPDLDGLRLAQLTDIHLGAFLSERELARAVDLANEFHAHLALVTGDFISDHDDPLYACLQQLARLRTSGGIYGCLGNHEGYANLKDRTAEWAGRLGIGILRGESRLLRVGSTTLNLSGVDYQKMGGPYLVDSGQLVRPGSFNILLSHNPDVLPVAARQGYDAVISGHTHGGQLTVGIPGQPLSVARLYTPYIRGVYRAGKCVLYVSSGIGTVGVPVRVGAPPEVSLLRLRAGKT